MKKNFHNTLFVFLGCFFATTIIISLSLFFSFYQQISLMTKLIAVSQYEQYKVYIYFDKSFPTSDVNGICFGKIRSDIKGVIYVNTPGIFSNTRYEIGVIGKTDNMCDYNSIKKWSNIVWSDSGIAFGNDAYFLKSDSYSFLK